MNKKFWKDIIVALILVLSFWLWVGSEAFGVTYYLQADGTAANKEAASGPCGTLANCMTIAVRDGEGDVYSGDDIFKYCDDGGIFREQLDAQSNGTSGHPIIHIAETGDTPKISGYDIISSWSLIGAGSGTQSNGVTLTYSATIGKATNNKRVLVVSVAIEDANNRTITGVTYDGNAMVEGGTQLFSANDNQVGLYYIIDANMPAAAGTYDVVVTANDTCDLNSGAISLYNVDQGNPLDVAVVTNTSAIATVSVNITPVTNGAWIIDSVSQPSSDVLIWPDVNQVERYQSNADCRFGMSHKMLATAGATTMGWTRTNAAAWGIVAAAFRPDGVIACEGISYYGTSDPDYTWPDDTVGMVLVDSTTRLTWEGTLANLDAGEFYHDGADTLHIRLSGDANPSGYTIEALDRYACVSMRDIDYITVDGLILEGGVACIQFSEDGGDGSDYGVVKNCTLQYAGEHGAKFSNSSTNGKVHNNTIQYFGSGNSWAAIAVHIDAGADGGADGSHGCEIYENLIQNSSEGILIRDSDNCKAYRNKILDLTGCGNGCVEIKDSDGVDIHHNIVECGPVGPAILLRDGSLTAELYNNVVITAYDKWGILIKENSTGATVKNNIGYATWGANSRNRAFTVNDDGSDTNLTADNNCWYHATGDIVKWLGIDYNASEWAAYLAASSQDANSLTSDPLFTNAVGGDFTLKPSSPCRNGATFLSGYETKLSPKSSWPDAVVTMDDILTIGAYGVYRGAAGQ